jgi:hypothetical protein
MVSVEIKGPLISRAVFCQQQSEYLAPEPLVAISKNALSGFTAIAGHYHVSAFRMHAFSRPYAWSFVVVSIVVQSQKILQIKTTSLSATSGILVLSFKTSLTS